MVTWIWISHFILFFLSSQHCTEVRFASFLSGGFTTTYDSNKSTRKEIGKTHLCALHCMEFENKSGKMPSFDAVWFLGVFSKKVSNAPSKCVSKWKNWISWMISKSNYRISSYSFLPWLVSSPWIVSSSSEETIQVFIT